MEAVVEKRTKARGPGCPLQNDEGNKDLHHCISYQRVDAGCKEEVAPEGEVRKGDAWLTMQA